MRKLLLTYLCVFIIPGVLTLSGCSKESDNGTSPPSDFIKLGNLEIRTTDFAQMTPEDGETVCRNLGQGWRFPTVEEMIWIGQNKNQIPDIKSGGYWTSTVSGGSRYSVFYESSAGMYKGFLETDLTKRMYIRAVR